MESDKTKNSYIFWTSKFEFYIRYVLRKITKRILLKMSLKHSGLKRNNLTIYFHVSNGKVMSWTYFLFDKSLMVTFEVRYKN